MERPFALSAVFSLVLCDTSTYDAQGPAFYSGSSSLSHRPNILSLIQVVGNVVLGGTRNIRSLFF